jgi:hypothetical protein
MRFYKRLYLTVLTVFMATAAYAQEARPLTKTFIVKTNLLSLLAQQPTVSVEKVFRKNVSVEGSFVQGKFNHFLLTDHYDYNGFLVRVKKYFGHPGFGQICPYAAVYSGSLQRNIQTKGQTFIPFLFAYRSRNFSANSIRAGGTFGISWFTKNRIIIDYQNSLGYGRYLHLDKNDPDTYAKGYPDIQLWLSVGYCF